MKYNIDVKKLTELLQKKTIKQASVHLDVPYHAVWAYCKKHKMQGVVSRGRTSKSGEHVDDVINLYLDGMSQNEISKKLGLSRHTVAALVKKGSHHMRTRSEAARLRDVTLTPEQLKERAKAANAVRHAMGILNLFSF